jgi:hypothetical protein
MESDDTLTEAGEAGMNTTNLARLFTPGVRVQLIDETLQAFYGRYGTVVRVRPCSACREQICVVMQMDDTPPSEGCAVFYPAQIRALSAQPMPPAPHWAAARRSHALS